MSVSQYKCYEKKITGVQRLEVNIPIIHIVYSLGYHILILRYKS